MVKRNQRGITLIALVITIIVLLILAGVTINTLLGDNGILGRTQTAATEHEKAAVLETLKLAVAEGEMEHISNPETSKKVAYQTALEKTGATITSATDEKIEGTTPKNNKTYAFEVNVTTGDVKLIDETTGTTPTTTATTTTYTTERTATGSNLSFTDSNTVTVTIPKGFTVSGLSNEATVAGGLVIYDLAGADTSAWDATYWTTNKDTIQETYNQFVWVPVENEEEFIRYTGYYEGELDTECVPGSGITEPYADGDSTEISEYTAMKASVTTNHGFYIARYEASQGTDSKAESKRGKPVWNDIAWGTSMSDIGKTGAVYRSQQMYTSSDYNVTSTLVYGTQWDAVMTFFDKNYKSGNCEATSFVVNSSGNGYYNNLDRNIYGIPGNTGLFPYKNIYDMAGNVSEWTMEASGIEGEGRIFRGRLLCLCWNRRTSLIPLLRIA